MEPKLSIISQTPAYTAHKFIKECLEVTPEKRESLSEYDLGYRSSLNDLMPKINDSMSIEDIQVVCTARRVVIFKDIDARIEGTEKSRKDEMTIWERGALHGANDVGYCF